MATQLCDGGHVRVNGSPAKPSTKVRAGDVVHALIAGRERILEVVRPIETRVGAPVAATCYVDKQPTARSPRGRTRHQGGPRRGSAEQASSPGARTDTAGRAALMAVGNPGRSLVAVAFVLLGCSVIGEPVELAVRDDIFTPRCHTNFTIGMFIPNAKMGTAIVQDPD
jgi:ribosomal 50S subunit-recycling heat shock protein